MQKIGLQASRSAHAMPQLVPGEDGGEVPAGDEFVDALVERDSTASPSWNGNSGQETAQRIPENVEVKAAGETSNRSVHHTQTAPPSRMAQRRVGNAQAVQSAENRIVRDVQTTDSGQKRHTAVRSIDTGEIRFSIGAIKQGETKPKVQPVDNAEEEIEAGGQVTIGDRLIRCPGCGSEVSEKSVVCVSCGEFLRS